MEFDRKTHDAIRNCLIKINNILKDDIYTLKTSENDKYQALLHINLFNLAACIRTGGMVDKGNEHELEEFLNQYVVAVKSLLKQEIPNGGLE